MQLKELLTHLLMRSQSTSVGVAKILRILEEQKSNKEPAEPTVLKEYVSYSTLDVMFSAIRYGRKIEAIKSVRMLTSCGLKEAKDLVEKYF